MPKQITYRFWAALVALFTIYSFPSLAQEPVQTVRGRVFDEDSRTPLPGANVRIVDSGMGSGSDAEGNFRISNVPVGRVNLAISFVGYEERLISNVLVTAGKETVLEVYLKESLMMMNAVEVRATSDKSEVSNEMALSSARGFTVEETKRYAGSFNDPGRMVSGYAGVDSDPTGNNTIIVRGNSPKGIQWRLEGIEIPNPNHFSDEGATGGPINALNSQMLTNSEFYSGAFAPEFGNALSGVFDMKLRKGNNEKQECSFALGALGTEAAIEGPFRKGSGSSYLVNYRYSTLSMLNSLGIVDFDGIPKYQDLSFKVFLPTKSLGTFSVFGLGGKSNITEELFDENDPDLLLERGFYRANMGVAGITQYWPLSSSTYIQNSVTVSRNGSGYLGYEPNQAGILSQDADLDLRKKTLRAATTLNHKVNASHNVQAGVIFTRHSFDFYHQYLHEETGEFELAQNHSGHANQFQAFVSWKYRPAPKVSIVSGFHSQKVSLNKEMSIEPRMSMRYQFRPLQAFTTGFGLHSKMESLPNYFSVIPGETGEEKQMPNRNLKLSRARHYVVGYENKLTQNLFLKAEAYYQQLYNVPVENDPTSSYSLINQVEGFTDRALVNRGEGRNVGLELTLERYFADQYYFLVTSSIFDSRYRALDGQWRNTLFNANFLGNVLVGKEFRLKSRNHKNKTLGINARISSMGARRYTPINLAESIAKQETVYYEDQAFSRKGDHVFIANLAISYRIDHKRISQELKLDIQNATNNAARIGYFYNENTRKIESFEQLPILPVIIYTINFQGK